MMKWLEAPIKEVADVMSGFGFPREQQGSVGEEYPFFKVGDMNLPGNEKEMTVKVNTISEKVLRKLNAKAFPAGTIIFPKIGAAIATNKKRMLVMPSLVDNNVMGLIPKPIIDKWYLFYWMQQFDLRSVSNIGPVPSMRKSEVEKVTIPLPTLYEQHRIVELLDRAQTLRKKRSESDAKAAQILPTLFYKIFGDPVTNPKGWKHISIRTIVMKIERRDPSESPDTYFKYVDIAGVDGTTGRITQAKDLLGVDAPGRARQIVRTNDVLVSTVRPYLRATALVPAELDNQVCSTGFCVLRAKDNVGYGYLYALSRLDWFTQRLNERARGASYPAVTDNDILGLQVPYTSEQKMLIKCDRFVINLNAQQEKRILLSAKIDDIFNLLLHKAFSGDLTAKWREAHMKELLAEMEEQAKCFEAARMEGE